MQVIVSEGVPFLEILRKAEDFQVDAIMMGRFGHRGPIEKVLFGTTAEHVIRGTSRAVIVVPVDTEEETSAAEHSAGPEGMNVSEHGKTILFRRTIRRPGRDALDHAVSLAKQAQAATAGRCTWNHLRCRLGHGRIAGPAAAQQEELEQFGSELDLRRR